jgi:hypothetical protein
MKLIAEFTDHKLEVLTEKMGSEFIKQYKG